MSSSSGIFRNIGFLLLVSDELFHRSVPASAASNNKTFLIPLYNGSISQFSARLWAPSQGPAPVEIEEMPSRRAALELFDPALPIGGSKPITRCTASEMRTRDDSR